ncbi:hypothetical protein BO79DRAFT_217990 [Aspergillus costaricaensis CBS 115574]|uniref:Uncharacterized protein n=1 Tax=Aspergillus costaricaensis CBS 115574 TaxID=1448317 RepID=A0ACD1IF19_9EURO|nr:hypothetical protein BO79DRAFT_217990 [Aspergillus costaricaensis CBS 115574]RAK88682.1 hypothetical protein BO79DRAFT_217990 [Aspergillus costaricaensis CBS 115574]
MTGSACRWRKKTGSSLVGVRSANHDSQLRGAKSPALNRPAGNAIPEILAAPALANLDDHQPAQEDDWWGLSSSVTLESVRTNLKLPQFRSSLGCGVQSNYRCATGCPCEWPAPNKALGQLPQPRRSGRSTDSISQE